jgi:hypothetical protein
MEIKVKDSNLDRPTRVKIPPHRNLFIKIKKNQRLLIIALVAILLVVFFYSYIHTRNQLNQLKNGAGRNPQNQQLVTKVSKLADLPSDEVPSTYTVKSVEKIKNQPFFRNAHNGDRVLIYAKAGQAILYRPSND